MNTMVLCRLQQSMRSWLQTAPNLHRESLYYVMEHKATSKWFLGHSISESSC